jgi:hypothetical protein
MSTMTGTPTASTWWVEVFLGEIDGVSTASARLHTRDRTGLSAKGTAKLGPRDRDVPEIGYELATARALMNLAHELMASAADDISGVTHEDVTADDLEHTRPKPGGGTGWPSVG